jgi:Ribosomal protein L7/L12 C-terminal domain
MTQPYPFSITHESITVVVKGSPTVVQKGSPNFEKLREAILKERWDEVESHLTIKESAKTSVEAYAKGNFTFKDGKFFLKGKEIPYDIHKRIMEMANKNEDPAPLFRFWERLKKNPSYRSVEQLWTFLTHKGIPLTKDGCFLAYKAVQSDYKDVHSSKYVNEPGTIHEMPRNEISDDPKVECHVGFHVGALGYAQSFGPSNRIIVICKIDPENVVSVPYDSSAQKMRVCKYKVVGLHNGNSMPNTLITDEYNEDIGTPDELNEDEKQFVVKNQFIQAIKEVRTRTGLGLKEAKDLVDAYRQALYTEQQTREKATKELELSDPEVEIDGEKVEVEKVEVNEVKKAEKQENDERHRPVPTDVDFPSVDKLNTASLMELSLDVLRQYAGKHLKIVGASKILGGKTGLVAAIMKVRN